MKWKVFVCILGILIIMLVQTTILDYIKIEGIKPNLIIVYIVCSSILEGSTWGALIGLLSGGIQDIVAGKLLGFYAMLGMYLGIVSGAINKMLFRDSYVITFMLTFVLTLAYETGTYLLSGLGGLRSEIFFAFKKVVLPEALYNSVFSIFIYYILTRINMRFKVEGKAARKY